MVSRRKSGVGHFAAKQESIVIVLNNHLTFAIQKCYNDGNDDVLIDEVVRISKIIAVRVICFFGAKLDNAAVVLLRKVRLHPCYYCPQPTPIVSLRRDPHPHGLESAFRATTRCFCGSQVPGRSICQHGSELVRWPWPQTVDYFIVHNDQPPAVPLATLLPERSTNQALSLWTFLLLPVGFQ